MKITAFKIRNYRTLEDVDLDFPSSYTAVCGPNDSGKTNVVKAIRALMKEESPFQIFRFDDEEELSFKNDFPKWRKTSPSERQIRFEIQLEVDDERDAGFYLFLKKQLSLNNPEPILALSIELIHGPDRPEPDVKVSCSGNDYAGVDAQEILKRLQTSRSILFHNSTQVDPRLPFRPNIGGVIRAESGEHEALVASMKKTVDRGLRKISRIHQGEIEGLLGRLETQYRVGLSMPTFEFDSIPFSITLGQKNFDVPLDDWGSGTKNRTLILMTLFRAKQLSESETSAGKITPVIVIEEPESFLHPAAQAEFGRVLRDLAEEFQVQVIITTHSPYLLSIDEPNSNILLKRHVRYKQLQETQRIDTNGDNWMEPFGLALGLESEEFKPWKDIVLSGSESILLVEGKIDKQYFDMLRSDDHGTNRLSFSGEIVSYDGTGSLQNTVLLRFIKNRHPKFFVTYDLDAEEKLARPLKALGLKKKSHFYPVGVNSAGKRCIEGLLPESITKAVYASNPTLVQAATSGTKNEKASAQSNLKNLMFEEFRNSASPGKEYFGKFYTLVKIINKALC